MNHIRLVKEFLPIDLHYSRQNRFDNVFAVNDLGSVKENFIFVLQFVIEAVRGKSFLGDIAIDDIYLMTSCTTRGKNFS